MMFVKGIFHGTAVLLATLASMGLSFMFADKDVSEIMAGLTVILGWLIVGYIYRKNTGPLLFSEDGKALSRLDRYVLGVGLIWGPARLFAIDFPIPEINPIFNVALILVSVPLAGMSVIGALIVGGLFYRGKKRMEAGNDIKI